MDKSNNFLLNNDGLINKNIFTTGWASSPSVGVIGTNKGRALEIVKKILSLTVHTKKDSTDKLKEKIITNKLVFISKEQWKSIDKIEESNAMPSFVREKFNNVNIALDILKKN